MARRRLWFSATDVARAINDEPDYTKADNYWRWLKRKLTQDGIQLVSVTHGFKSEVQDGNQRKDNVLNSDGVAQPSLPIPATIR